jgi:NAD(P)H-nitrite reductase large subunit
MQFTHVTRFLGRKVVLLGLYNGQKLQQQPEGDVIMYSRVLDAGSPDATFVRVLLLRGRMQGAVLIGETELEETFENLILDGLDLSQFGPSLLDPDIELDHVFD